MLTDKERLETARNHIVSRQYDEARAILEEMPNNSTAQLWLTKITDLVGKPKKPETLAPAVTDFPIAEPASKPYHINAYEDGQEEDNDEVEIERSQIRVIGIFIFLGTLLGSLLGATADFSEAMDSVQRVREAFYPELCIVGSNTILGDGIAMSGEWEAEFEKEHDVRIRIEGIGSVKGVERAVEGGCVHILAMSEPMLDSQYQALTDADMELQCATEIGYDVIAFVTDINNKRPNTTQTPVIDENNLAKILRGEITNWQDANGPDVPIYLLARPGSGTTQVVLLRYVNLPDFPAETIYFACDSNDGCLDMTLSTPGSLYWVSSAWMRTQPEEYLRVVPILRGDDFPDSPLSENFDIANYPYKLVRPLYFYVLNGKGMDQESVELAEAFLAYVRSVKGQQILGEYGFYEHFNRPLNVKVEYPSGSGFELESAGPRMVCR